jgi:hypothetical protein
MLINDLSPFFIDEKKMHLLLNSEFKKNSKEIGMNITPIQVNPTKNQKQSFRFTIPKENDKLFWCYFIIIHGEIAYQIQENKHILFEKNKKIDLVSKVRENKTILKQYKLTSLSELESNLSNDKYLSLVSFFSLMILEEKNVVYLKKKCFFKSFMNDSDTVYLISHNYGVCEITKAQFDELKEANLEINSLTKPIKSMTAYKLDDLKYICEKLSIQLGEKRNKKDLYEQIVQFFSHF